MIENTLTHYDYIMAQIYWEISKDFETRSNVEKRFLNSLLRKYQILVLLEPEYSKPDKEERIADLVSKVPELDGSVENVLVSFNEDIRVILDNEIPREPEPFRLDEDFPVGDFPVGEEYPRETVAPGRETLIPAIPVATMGMQSPTEKKIIKQVVAEHYTSLDKDARKELLEGRTKAEFERDAVSVMQQMMLQMKEHMNRMEHNLAIRMQQGSEELLKGTQMEGDRIVEIIEKRDEKTSDQLAELIDRTEGLQNLTGLTLSKKNFPKFLFNAIVCGVKRLAITTTDIALFGPKTIINATFIKPHKLVGKRTNSLIEIFQEIMGWCYVAFYIAGAVVIYSHPEMEPWRMQIYEAFATVKEMITFDVIENATPATMNQLSNEIGQCSRESDYYSVFYFFVWPTRKTVELLACSPPLLRTFFRLTLETMYETILRTPGYLAGWAWQLFSMILAEFKNAVIEGVKGAVSNVKFWPFSS